MSGYSSDDIFAYSLEPDDTEPDDSENGMDLYYSPPVIKRSETCDFYSKTMPNNSSTNKTVPSKLSKSKTVPKAGDTGKTTVRVDSRSQKETPTRPVDDPPKTNCLKETQENLMLASLEEWLEANFSSFRAEVEDGYNQVTEYLGDVRDRINEHEDVAEQLWSKLESIESELKKRPSSPSSSSACDTPKRKSTLQIRVSFYISYSFSLTLSG